MQRNIDTNKSKKRLQEREVFKHITDQITTHNFLNIWHILSMLIVFFIITYIIQVSSKTSIKRLHDFINRCHKNVKISKYFYKTTVPITIAYGRFPRIFLNIYLFNIPNKFLKVSLLPDTLYVCINGTKL